MLVFWFNNPLCLIKMSVLATVPWQLGSVAFVGDRPLCRGRYSLVAQG